MRWTGVTNFLLAIVSTVVCVVVLDVGLGLFLKYRGHQIDPVKNARHSYSLYRGHALNPEYTPQLGDAPMEHSPDGFKSSREYSVVKPEKTIRIIMLGGSTLYGIGAHSPYEYKPDLQNDETIPAFLEESINRRLEQEGSAYRAEIMNAGVVGYYTFQHLVYLNERLLQYQPDIVVNFDGVNDFFFFDPEFNPWLDYSHVGAIEFLELVDERDYRTGMHLLIGYLARHSSLAYLFEQKFSAPYFREMIRERANERMQTRHPNGLSKEFNEESYAATARNTFMRALWQINQLGRYACYDHVVFLQPEVRFEDRATLNEEDVSLLDITNNVAKPGMLTTMREAQAVLPSLFGEYGIPYVDLGSINGENSSKDNLYVDYCHLTPAGSRLVARLMEPFVYSMVKQRIAAPVCDGVR